MKPDDREFAEAVRVVSGNPTEEELAAAIATIQEASKQQGQAKQAARSSWSLNLGLLRTDITPGHGQWQSSYRSGL